MSESRLIGTYSLERKKGCKSLDSCSLEQDGILGSKADENNRYPPSGLLSLRIPKRGRVHPSVRPSRTIFNRWKLRFLSVENHQKSEIIMIKWRRDEVVASDVPPRYLFYQRLEGASWWVGSVFFFRWTLYSARMWNQTRTVLLDIDVTLDCQPMDTKSRCVWKRDRASACTWEREREREREREIVYCKSLLNRADGRDNAITHATANRARATANQAFAVKKRRHAAAKLSVWRQCRVRAAAK